MGLTLDDLKPGGYSVVSEPKDEALTLDKLGDFQVVSPPPEALPAFARGPKTDLMSPAEESLRGAPAAPQGPPVSAGEAFGRGAAQGATMGFRDEAQAGAETGLHRFGKWVAEQFGLQPGGPSDNAQWRQEYEQKRDAIRAADANAAAQHPVASGLGDIVGTVGATALGGAALAGAGAPGAAAALNAPKTLAQAVAGGAATGAARGTGDAKELADVPREAAFGGVTGAGAGAVGHAVVAPAMKWASKRVAEGGKRLAEALGATEQGAHVGKKLAAGLGRVEENIPDVMREAKIPTSAPAAKQLAAAEKAIAALPDRTALYEAIDSKVGGVSPEFIMGHIEDELARVKGKSLVTTPYEAALSDLLDDMKAKPAMKGGLVPLTALRDLVSSAQNVAGKSAGNPNPSVRAKVERQVSQLMGNILDDHLANAVEAAPELAKPAAEIAKFNRDYSTLKSLRDVFADKAEKEARGASGLGALAKVAGGASGTYAAGAGLPKVLERAGMDKDTAETVGGAAALLSAAGTGVAARKALTGATASAADALARVLTKHPEASAAILKRYGAEAGQRILDLATKDRSESKAQFQPLD